MPTPYKPAFPSEEDLPPGRIRSVLLDTLRSFYSVVDRLPNLDPESLQFMWSILFADAVLSINSYVLLRDGASTEDPSVEQVHLAMAAVWALKALPSPNHGVPSGFTLR